MVDELDPVVAPRRRVEHDALAEGDADRRPDRVVWPGTLWEWAVLRPENGAFDTNDCHGGYARPEWFYQAQIESPAMFRRIPGAGSLKG